VHEILKTIAMPTTSEIDNQSGESLIGATDQLEQAAAEIARRNGQTQVTDKDRRTAYEQLRKTAPPARSGPPTPNET
jgi:hypothetical protein